MEKTTVLIIEDEAKLLKTLSDYLTIHQYRVLQASNGLDGIQQFSSHHECGLHVRLLPSGVR